MIRWTILNKIENCGVRGTQLAWFKDYLDQRLQCVSCNDVTSKFKTKFGVPQGSNLEPLLFLIYIYDLPSPSSKSSLILFAGDTNIFLSDRSLEELFKVANQELIYIADWFKANWFSLSLLKTNFYFLDLSESYFLSWITHWILIMRSYCKWNRRNF